MENLISKGREDHTAIRDKITAAEGEINEHDRTMQKNQERIELIKKEIWSQNDLNHELTHKLEEKDREIDHIVANK